MEHDLCSMYIRNYISLFISVTQINSLQSNKVKLVLYCHSKKEEKKGKTARRKSQIEEEGVSQSISEPQGLSTAAVERT